MRDTMPSYVVSMYKVINEKKGRKEKLQMLSKFWFDHADTNGDLISWKKVCKSAKITNKLSQ